jgi:hypothetical protein
MKTLPTTLSTVIKGIAIFLGLIIAAALFNNPRLKTQSASSKIPELTQTASAPEPTPTATPTPVPSPTPDPARTTPTEQDKAEAREWARQVARTRINNDIWAKMYPEKARIERMKRGPGLSIEQYAEFEAGNEEMFDTSDYKPLFPKNVPMQRWFVGYTVPIVKVLMGRAAVIFMHHGQDAVTLYFYDLKDHPKSWRKIAETVHRGIAEAKEESDSKPTPKQPSVPPGKTKKTN